MFVVQRTFSRVRRGYDPDEVDRHLELVSQWFTSTDIGRTFTHERSRLQERERAVSTREAEQARGIEGARLEAEATLEGARRRADAEARTADRTLAAAQEGRHRRASGCRGTRDLPDRLLRAPAGGARLARRLTAAGRVRRSRGRSNPEEVPMAEFPAPKEGIKLDTVAADILGKSGRDMLDALVAGETDPDVLANLARRQMRRKIPALRQALAGHFDAHHRLWIGAILRHIDFLDEQIEQLTGMIAEQIRPFAPAVELLCTIPGIQRRGAECIIGEIGTDMTCFATARHLASWAGLCPGNDKSAGKRRSGKTRDGSKWLDFALEEAAMAAIRVKGHYLEAQYRRLKPRRGHKRALGAIKHTMICAIWHMLSTGETYRDLGGDYFTNRDPERQTRRLVAQLERLGHHVTLTEGAAAA